MTHAHEQNWNLVPLSGARRCTRGSRLTIALGICTLAVCVFVPLLILRGFGYGIGVYDTVWGFAVVCGMGFSYRLTRLQVAGRRRGTPLATVARGMVSWVRNAALYMLVFSATGDGVGMFHALVALAFPVLALVLYDLRYGDSATDAQTTAVDTAQPGLWLPCSASDQVA